MTEELEAHEISIPKDLDDRIHRAILEGRFDDEESLILSAVEELIYMELLNSENLKIKDIEKILHQ